MKKMLFAVAALSAITFASCSDKKAEFKKNYTSKCKAEGASQMPNEKAKDAFNKFCDCSADKLVTKFSEKELEEMDKAMAANSNNTEMQNKMMPVIQPCLDDMQKEIMASMGAGQ